jgi:hypothetical protein
MTTMPGPLFLFSRCNLAPRPVHPSGLKHSCVYCRCAPLLGQAVEASQLWVPSGSLSQWLIFIFKSFLSHKHAFYPCSLPVMTHQCLPVCWVSPYIRLAWGCPQVLHVTPIPSLLAAGGKEDALWWLSLCFRPPFSHWWVS